MLGVLFALIALVGGWACCRALGVGLALAPAAGLALLAVVGSWATALGLPLTPGVAVGLGIAAVVAHRRGGRFWPASRERWTVGMLVLAAALPAAMLGIAFAGLGAPISQHDGAFHVETIDALRNGLRVETWYPRGYHAAVVAVLGLAPWVDTARGTSEASQGLSVLAPLAVFGLASALGARARTAALAALFQALTFVYPYDFQLWGGWPLAMGVVLTLGAWTAALWWIAHPSAGLAALFGLIAGAILLTHGTEVYTVSLGLLVICLGRARRIDWQALARHLPLAVGLAVAVALPYLPPLLGWAGGGGASASGVTSLESTALDSPLQGRVLVEQVGLAAVGATSFVDLPLRAALIALGARQARARLATGLWLTFGLVVALFAFVSQPLLDAVFVVTFPWLAEQRLLQLATVFASVLAAGGLVAALGWYARLRARLALTRPTSAWRLAVAGAVLLGLLGESSGVSIYKRLALASDSSYTVDDNRAMLWLRQQAVPGVTLANDASADAGIWAPYKAGLPIVQPRSGAGADAEQRQLVLDNIADLNSQPRAAAEACRLGVRYVYYGARLYGDDTRGFPPPAALALAPGLDEVFRSGEAVVFQTRLVCS